MLMIDTENWTPSMYMLESSTQNTSGQDTLTEQNHASSSSHPNSTSNLLVIPTAISPANQEISLSSNPNLTSNMPASNLTSTTSSPNQELPPICENPEILGKDEAELNSSNQPSTSMGPHSAQNNKPVKDSSQLEDSSDESSSEENNIPRASPAEIMIAFSGYKINWNDFPKTMLQALQKGEPLGNRYNDFVHQLVAEMRNISKFLTVPVCREIAKQILNIYPKSFGILDHTGKLMDLESVHLTTTIINHNNYLNRRDKVKCIPQKNVKPRNLKRVISLVKDIPNFSGVQLEAEKTQEQLEEDRIWLKNNATVVLNEIDSQKRDILFDSTFNLQRKFLNNFDTPPSIQQIKFEWPLLMKKKFLLAHFNKLMNFESNVFYENFQKSIKNINTICNTLQSQNNDDFSAFSNIVQHFKENMEYIYCNFPVRNTNN